MNKNQLAIVKGYEIFKRLFHKIDAIIVNCCRDCHNKFYHTFEYQCEYDFKLTNIRNKEIVNLTIFDESICLN